MDRKYRSIFISDVHLGSKTCQANLLDVFLHDNSCEVLYLLGDIIDGWRLRKNLYWPQKHLNVIRRFLSVTKNHNSIIYIIGNHDNFLEPYLENGELTFGHIKVMKETIHTSPDGKKQYYILHGDKFDFVIKNMKWLAHIGDTLYNWIIRLNPTINFIRKVLFGRTAYWSLSGIIKTKVKNSISLATNFEKAISDYVTKYGFEGVICGHSHCPELKDYNEFTYMNCGDWMDSCSAIVEHHDGRFELIKIGRRITE